MVDKKNFGFAELEQWFNERRVTEIECLVPDLTGVARGKILPREKFTEDRGMRLPEAVVAMGVTGEFPEEGPYYDVISPNDRDMHLRPDPSTVRIVPWAAEPVAVVIHDCEEWDGRPVQLSPRAVLRRVLALREQAKAWRDQPPASFYFLPEAVDFCDWLAQRRLRLRYLDDVIAYERATLELERARTGPPPVQLVRFRHDPVALLSTLARGRRPRGIPERRCMLVARPGADGKAVWTMDDIDATPQSNAIRANTPGGAA